MPPDVPEVPSLKNPKRTAVPDQQDGHVVQRMVRIALGTVEDKVKRRFARGVPGVHLGPPLEKEPGQLRRQSQRAGPLCGCRIRGPRPILPCESHTASGLGDIVQGGASFSSRKLMSNPLSIRRQSEPSAGESRRLLGTSVPRQARTRTKERQRSGTREPGVLFQRIR
jgi:hypothetical protein